MYRGASGSLVVAFGVSDQSGDVLGVFADFGERGQVAVDHIAAQEEVLGGVAQNALFGEDGQARAGLAGLFEAGQHAADVGVDVADGWIGLYERDLHGHTSGRASIRGSSAW